MKWEGVVALCPSFPRGWYELSRLSVEDRVEFTRDYWLSKLPYHPKAATFFTDFFSKIDDVGILLTKRHFDDPFEAVMVYSLRGDRGFFRGEPPATKVEIAEIRSFFSEYILPRDYISFLQIHNGFSKATDETGVISTRRLEESFAKFRKHLEAAPAVSSQEGIPLDPKALIPFYESFGQPFYQCFFAEWYPEEEMGNVYYSGVTCSISDTKGSNASESMAFTTFLDWLMFYLELVE